VSRGAFCRIRSILLFNTINFYARQHICYSAYMTRQFRLSVRPFVRLSHACIVSKRLNVSSKFFHYLIGPFSHQGSLSKSDGFTPNGGAKYKGVSNFRPICGYISERVLDRGIVTSGGASYRQGRAKALPFSFGPYLGPYH